MQHDKLASNVIDSWITLSSSIPDGFLFRIQRKYINDVNSYMIEIFPPVSDSNWEAPHAFIFYRGLDHTVLFENFVNSFMLEFPCDALPQWMEDARNLIQHTVAWYRPFEDLGESEQEWEIASKQTPESIYQFAPFLVETWKLNNATNPSESNCVKKRL